VARACEGCSPLLVEFHDGEGVEVLVRPAADEENQGGDGEIEIGAPAEACLGGREEELGADAQEGRHKAGSTCASCQGLRVH